MIILQSDELAKGKWGTKGEEKKDNNRTEVNDTLVTANESFKYHMQSMHTKYDNGQVP